MPLRIDERFKLSEQESFKGFLEKLCELDKQKQIDLLVWREFSGSIRILLDTIYTRQIRMGYLIEQLPDPENRVELSETLTDNLGLPRPKLTYRVREDYVRNAFVSAKDISTKLFDALGAREYTKAPPAPVFYGDKREVTSNNFEYQGNNFTFYGAGHIVGTYRMGDCKDTSVVNPRQQSWDHSNLFLVGSGVFPTVATGNPTLTLAALAFQAADHVLADLKAC